MIALLRALTRRSPTPPAAALMALLAGCASSPLVPEGSTAVEAMRQHAADGDNERVVLVWDRLALDASADHDDRAEGAWLAAEAHMAEEDHLLAFYLYREILETWPWSPHAGKIGERLYELGETFLFDERYGGWIFHSRGRGVNALETLVAHFQRSDIADDALLLVGEYFLDPEVGDLHEAALTFERLVKEYPDSEWVEKALWMAGHARLQSCHGSSYDRDDLLRTEAVLRRSLQMHPRGMHADEVAADLTAVREMLAENEVLVAEFYARRGHPDGEQVRLANAAILYPGTTAGGEARRRLEERGLDPVALAQDPALNAIDNAVPGVDRFRDRGSVFGFGF